MTVHGRDRELALLDDLVAKAAKGQGGALAVRSGPGLGRTTLLRWAARRAASEFRVVSLPGVRVESKLPRAALGRILPSVPDDLREVFRRIERVLDRYAEQAQARRTAVA